MHRETAIIEQLGTPRISSEGEGGADAEDLLLVVTLGTDHSDLVITIGSIGGDGPLELVELVVTGVGGTVGLVLVVEGRAVPVDMDVEVVNGVRVGEATDKLELDILVLDERRSGRDLGLTGIESEISEVVVASAEGGHAGITDLLVSDGLDELADEVVDLGEVGPVDIDGVGGSNADESDSSESHFLY